MAKKATKSPKVGNTVETIMYDAQRASIPTAEHQSVVKQEQQRPVRVKYSRNSDLDPQFVWCGMPLSACR